MYTNHSAASVAFAKRFMARQFARDLRAFDAQRQARKAENAAARAACLANASLCATLASEAQRRGEPAINWPEYFRALDINE